MKAGILIAAIVCLSILIAGFIIKTDFPNKHSVTLTQKTLPANVQTYHDPTYGYILTFPQSFNLSYASRRILLSDMNTTFSVNVETSASFLFSPRQSLISFCTSIIKKPCLIDSQMIFTNSNGVTGASYYFTLASRGAVLTNLLKGPVYTFPVVSSENKKGLLMVYKEGLSTSDQEKDTLKTILQSLSIPLPTPSLFPTPRSSTSASIVPKVASSAAK